MRRRRIATVLAVAAGAAALAAPAGAARVDESCNGPSGTNGATTCQVVLRDTVSGPTESPVVQECLGEDVYVTLDVLVVGHQTFRPDGTLVSHADATVHGSGYGLVTGTPVVFNEPASAVIDNLPDGGMLIHEVSSGEVVTQGSAENLEFTIELQQLVAPDGTVVNEQENVQAKCGSDHESTHG